VVSGEWLVVSDAKGVFPQSMEQRRSIIRSLRHERCLLFLGLLLVAFAPPGLAQQRRSSGKVGTPNPDRLFPAFLRKDFDYATFTRFDADGPPKPGIYLSNGFLALEEQGFGGQNIIVPAPVDEAPGNQSDRLPALDIAAPIFTDRSSRSYDLATSPAKRSVTYFADRTVYRAAFEKGPDVSLTVLPIYGRSRCCQCPGHFF
jgi:hypothetical protein